MLAKTAIKYGYVAKKFENTVSISMVDEQSWTNEIATIIDGACYDERERRPQYGFEAYRHAAYHGIENLLVEAVEVKDGFVVAPDDSTPNRYTTLPANNMKAMSLEDLVDVPYIIRPYAGGIFTQKTISTNDKIKSLDRFMEDWISLRQPHISIFIRSKDFARLVAFVSHRLWRSLVVLMGPIMDRDFCENVNASVPAPCENWRVDIELAPLIPFDDLVRVSGALSDFDGNYFRFYDHVRRRCANIYTYTIKQNLRIFGFAIEYRNYRKTYNSAQNLIFGYGDTLLTGLEAIAFLVDEALVTFALGIKESCRVIAVSRSCFTQQDGNNYYRDGDRTGKYATGLKGVIQAGAADLERIGQLPADFIITDGWLDERGQAYHRDLVCST